MKTISTALKTHFAGQDQTTCTCWIVVQTNGNAYGFTNHDQDITFDLVAAMTAAGMNIPEPLQTLGSPTMTTYAAATGYMATDIQTTAALNVDNLEVQGMLVSPSITAADLRAGKWDYAFFCIFRLNWSDTTQGMLIERIGHLGQVNTQRAQFSAELRGLAQSYTRTLGELTQPACRANLGDARCKVDLTSFTVTGTVGTVSSDNTVIGDAGLTQPGPSAGVAITGITNANPAVVVMADASLGVTEGEIVTISGVVGAVWANATTVAHNPTGGTAFDLGIDTTDTGVYPAYVSGGTVTVLGGGSGYFDHGVIRFTSGANVGLSMEVKSYVPGQVTLMLPMPYLIVAGDTYSMHAGCDKLLQTCRDRFNNIVNMRAEPYLGGMDQLVQVGRHS